MFLEFAKYVSENFTGSLTLGTDFFVGHVPSEINETVDSVALIVIAFNQSDFASTGRLDSTFDFFIRNTEELDAKSLADAIFLFLNGNSGVTLPVVSGEPHSWIADVIEGVEAPRPLGSDDRGRYTYTFSIVVRGHII